MTRESAGSTEAPSENELVALVEKLEREDRLDPPTHALQAVAQRAIPDGPRRDLLTGKWLGHSLHPMLTDLPIGFWTSAWVFDIIGPRRHRDAARVLVALGVISAIPAVASGAADWSRMTGGSSRVGLVHAAANGSAIALYAGSWVARRRGRLGRGVMLGMAGATAATIAGYLGGHLAQASQE